MYRFLYGSAEDFTAGFQLRMDHEAHSFPSVYPYAQWTKLNFTVKFTTDRIHTLWFQWWLLKYSFAF